MKGKRIGASLAMLKLGCCVLAISLSGTAYAQEAAQDTPDEAAASNSEIIVTGSRVRGEAPVGSTVTTLGR